MKVSSIIVFTLLGVASCDQPSSSYAVLPYEDEIQSHQTHHSSHAAPNAYEQPNYYEPSSPYDYVNYDGGSGGKKGFSFGRIMKAPFKALKGAGSYMMGMFDDVTSKFLELNGSLLRAQGNFLQASGENLLRHAYSKAAKGNFYPIEPYYPPPYSYHAPTHHEPVDPYTSHGSNENIHGLKFGTPKHKDVLNTIDTGYHGPPESKDVGGGHGVHSDISSVHVGSGHSDISSGHVGSGHGGHGSHEEPFGSTYAIVPNQRREFVEQRSARSFSQPWRTDRSYSAAVTINDHRPIPVPVSIPVYPSRLIFPSLHHGVGGYH